jgi:hypothetical protein
LYITNPTCAALGTNPCLHGENPVANHLSYDMAESAS